MYFIHAQREYDEDPITLDEWKSIVEKDNEMEFSNEVTYTSPFGETVTKSGGFYGVWTPKDTDIQVVFTFEEGTISVIFDSRTLTKLQEISNQLNGFVFGDIGEEY